MAEVIIAIAVTGKISAVTSALLSYAFDQASLGSLADCQSLIDLQSNVDKQFNVLNTSLNILRDSHLMIAQTHFKDGLTAYCTGNLAEAKRYFIEAEKQAVAAFHTTTLAFEGKSCAIRIKVLCHMYINEYFTAPRPDIAQITGHCVTAFCMLRDCTEAKEAIETEFNGTMFSIWRSGSSKGDRHKLLDGLLQLKNCIEDYLGCTLQIVDSKGKEVCATSKLPAKQLKGHTNKLMDLVHIEDHLFSASHDGTIRVWDMQGNVEVASLTGHSGPVTDLVVLPIKGVIVSRSADNTVRAWNVADQTHKTVLGHAPNVSALHATKHNVVLCYGNGSVQLLGLITFAVEHEFSAHGPACINAVASADHLLFTGSSDKIVKVWDTNNKSFSSPVNTLTAHTKQISALLVSGDKLFTASEDTKIIAWTLPGLEQAYVLSDVARPFRHLAASKGRLYASSGDHRIAVWTTADHKLDKEIQTTDNANVTALTLSRGRLITGVAKAASKGTEYYVEWLFL